MKRLCAIAASLLMFSISVFAQGWETATIYLGVFTPDQMEDLNDSQLGKINTKIEQICSKSGIASGYTPDGFAIYPVFEIYDAETVEGGMQNVYSIKAQMTLFIKQYNGVLVGSVSKTYSGFGKSKNQAIVNAIQNINPQEPAFKRFMDNAKEKIVDYYVTHCGQMIDKAEMLSSQEKYDEAIALLMSIPENVTCYSNVMAKVSSLYEKMQDKICQQQISEAKVAFAKTDYDEAYAKIGSISATSKCYNEAMKMLPEIQEQQSAQAFAAAQTAFANRNYSEMASAIAKISPNTKVYQQAQALTAQLNEKLSVEEQRDWNFKVRQYKDARNLENKRISAIKEIAKAYYQNLPNIKYTQIIK